MKRIIIPLMIFLLCISFLYTLTVFILFGQDIPALKYYSDMNNYEDIICKNTENNYEIMEARSFYYEFVDFTITPENWTIQVNNGFNEEISYGDIVVITTAPRMFGDGWRYPIVGVRTDKKVYLDKSTGIHNYIEVRKEARVRAMKFILPGIIFSVIYFSLFVVCIFRRRKFKKTK